MMKTTEELIDLIHRQAGCLAKHHVYSLNQGVCDDVDLRESYMESGIYEETVDLIGEAKSVVGDAHLVTDRAISEMVSRIRSVSIETKYPSRSIFDTEFAREIADTIEALKKRVDSSN